MSDLAATAHKIAASGSVTPEDIRALRGDIFEDGIVSRTEAEALFAIERARTTHNDAWSELFVEALSDYALHQEQPRDYLSEDTANWIMGQIKLRKQPSMDADVALVAELIEKSREVPPAFSAFALRLTKDAVVYGDGADERGRMHKSGIVDAADIALLKRILWGAGSEGQLAVSREEAEALFAIADATTGAENDAEFDDLFAKAVGNYLIGATGRAVPTRQEAFEWSKRGDYHVSVIGALSAVHRAARPKNDDLVDGAIEAGHAAIDAGTSIVSTMLSALLGPFAPGLGTTFHDPVSDAVEQEHAHRIMVRDVDREVAEILTGDKAGWLRDHIGKNGVMSAPEKALARFLERECSALDPSLKDMFGKVA